MCGRFSQTRLTPELVDAFGITHATEIAARHNIAPSQPVAAVRATPGGRELTSLRWGLIPSWMKELPSDARLINARAEGVSEKPSFRTAFRKRRCLIPADGFFEWKKLPDRKQPYYIRFADRHLFAFAGLWEHWERDGQVIESCTIITTDANATMKSLHDRMPVILDPPDYPTWLGEVEAPSPALQDLLRPYAGAGLQAYAVSTRVNSPRNNDAACLEPVSSP